MPARDPVGPLSERLPQLFGLDDFDLVAEAQNPVDDFVDRLDHQNEVERAIRTGRLLLSVAPGHVADNRGHSRTEPEVNLPRAIARAWWLRLVQEPLQAKPRGNRIR